jgi:hypothetical protein
MDVVLILFQVSAGCRAMKRSAALLARCLCTAAALAALGALPSRGDEIDLPTRKAGLWDMKIRITGGGVPTMSMQQCTDAAADKDLRQIYSPMSKETCDKREVHKTAGGYTLDRVCKLDDDTYTTHADITGDFNQQYQAHLTTRSQDEAPTDPPGSDLTMEAKYAGPCKSDQQPGDIIFMGMKINIKDIIKLRQQSTDGSSGSN